MTSTLFLTYVQEFTCPTLHLGDIVTSTTTRSRCDGSQRAVEAMRAHIR